MSRYALPCMPKVLNFCNFIMQEEIWKPVVGYEGKYEVSNKGNIRSLSYMRTGNPKLLKFKEHNGYLSATLFLNGKRKILFVHRVVAEAFIPNVEQKPCIDHINTIRNDNRVENLRWVTYSENLHNPITYEKHCANAKTRNLGRKQSLEVRQRQSERQKGEGNPFFGKTHSEETRKRLKEYKNSEVWLRKAFKPVTQYDLHWNKIKDWVCAKYAEQELGLNNGSICSVLHNRKRTCGGFHWSYSEDPNKVIDDYFNKKIKHKKTV